MQDVPGTANILGEVAIQLLDPSSGRPVKSWTFRERDQITIGRSPDQDVEISDPYVSRNHARLDRREGGWVLVSLGRHGLVVANQLVTEKVISGELVFRLGTEGPTLKFSETGEQFFPSATMSFSSETGPIFQLDEDKLRRELDEIVDGDYFQSLQEKAREMRKQRTNDDR